MQVIHFHLAVLAQTGLAVRNETVESLACVVPTGDLAEAQDLCMESKAPLQQAEPESSTTNSISKARILSEVERCTSQIGG
eukprot:5387638-Amphidinium_carterae.1